MILDFLLIVGCAIGTIYHINLRNKLEYNEKVTVPMIVSMLLSSLLLILIGVMLNSHFYYYLVAASASIFIISGIVARGVNNDGIYFQSNGVRGIVVQLAPWESIEEIAFDSNNKKISFFKTEKKKIIINQHFEPDDFQGIVTKMHFKEHITIINE